jgi:hypothetical protein
VTSLAASVNSLVTRAGGISAIEEVSAADVMADTGESVAAGDAKDEALLPSVVLQALSSVRMPIIARMSKTGRTFPLMRGAFILGVEDFKL